MSFTVEGDVSDGVPVVKLAIHATAQGDTADQLAEVLTSKYRLLIDTDGCRTNDCTVVIQATTASTALVKALFILYKLVKTCGGVLYCIGFPKDHIPSLNFLGVLHLPGFFLEKDMESVLRKILNTNS